MLTRRDFGKLAMGAFPAAIITAKPNSVVNGVILGASTYSYRDLSLDEAFQALLDASISDIEFFEQHAQPRKEPNETWKDYGERMREWTRKAPLEHFSKIGARFKHAGIRIHGFTHGFRADDSDVDIQRNFDIARALGAKAIFSSTQVSVVGHIEPFCAKNQMPVAVHNHSELKPDEMTRPEDFEQAMRGNPHIGLNLDIGHCVAAGFDPIPLIEKHHSRIYAFHIKDRKKNQGRNTPFGEGDTPIKEVLQLCRRNKWRIPALIEYEYKGTDTPQAEVRKCLEYMKRALV